MRNAAIGLFIGLAVGAGVAWIVKPRPHEHAHEEPEEPRHQRTAWTDRTEIFLEHPPLAPGSPADFATHVTSLATHEARAAGPVTYVLASGTESIEVVDSTPARPGLYKSTLTFPRPGDWRVSVRVDSDTVDVGEFKVPSGATADEPEGIAFLKEQQWMLATRTERVARRTLVQRLRVPGVVAARPGARSALTAPVEGRLLPPSGRALPAPGERVEAGQVLGLVQPPFSDFLSRMVEAEAEVVRAQVAIEQAESTAARLRKLVGEKVRPERELSEAEFALRTARANLEAAKNLRGAYGKSGAVFTPEGFPAFEIRSPIAGEIVQVAAASGENIHTERPVFTILDASLVRVEARISEADLNRLGGSRAALLETPDAPGRLLPAGEAPVFISPEVDPATRTVSLAYDVRNGEGHLRIGMALILHVETGRAEEALALPESALVDEENRFVAFVQVAGETFEKRTLELGFRAAGFAQVLSGLNEGERVVTKGGYAVRLASLSPALPSHGHAH